MRAIDSPLTQQRLCRRIHISQRGGVGSVGMLLLLSLILAQCSEPTHVLAIAHSLLLDLQYGTVCQPSCESQIILDNFDEHSKRIYLVTDSCSDKVRSLIKMYGMQQHWTDTCSIQNAFLVNNCHRCEHVIIDPTAACALLYNSIYANIYRLNNKTGCDVLYSPYYVVRTPVHTNVRQTVH